MAVLPIVGALKYGDEIAELAQAGKKLDDLPTGQMEIGDLGTGSADHDVVETVGDAVRDWLGAGYVRKPSGGNSIVYQSADRQRQFRLDLQGHGAYPAHAHIEIWDSEAGDFIDAPGVPHHLYFRDVVPPNNP